MRFAESARLAASATSEAITPSFACQKDSVVVEVGAMVSTPIVGATRPSWLNVRHQTTH